MGINCDDYVDLLIQKDEKAFKIIYDQTKNSVYAIIRTIVKNEQLTEDLMQDTYIRAIEKIRTYKRNKKFKVWLNSIAHNLAMDYYRKHHQSISFDLVEHTFKTEVDYEKRALAEALLNKLTPIEKQIVLLKVIDEYTFKDIASIVDKPLGTVLWIYNKAIKKMRKEES